MYESYWETYAVTVYATCGLLTIVQSFMAIKVCKKQLGCLQTLLISDIIANLLHILEVAYLKQYTKWLAFAMSLQLALMNTSSCVMASRYLMVYDGNAYVMKGKEIPPECKSRQVKIFFSLLAFNWLVPFTLGFILICNDINLFDIVTCRSQFNQLMAFEIGNCLVQLIDVVILIVFISLTKKQLKDYGFNAKIHNTSILYQSISVLVMLIV
jgi:hypothetical protein